MNCVAILCALPVEIHPFREVLDLEEESLAGITPCWKGYAHGKTIVLVLSGMGKVHAAVAAQRIIHRYEPDAVFSCGTAGALDTRCQIGDVVVGTTTVQHDYGFVLPETFVHFGTHLLQPNRKRKFFQEFPADSSLLKASRVLQKEWDQPSRLFSGPIATGDQVIFSTEKRQQLFEQFSALAVDMESAAIAQVCKMNDIPFLAVRGISDYADELVHLDTSKIDPNDFARYASASFGEKVGLLTKTIRYLAQHPSAFTMSLQARKNAKIAAANSAELTLRVLQAL